MEKYQSAFYLLPKMEKSWKNMKEELLSCTLYEEKLHKKQVPHNRNVDDTARFLIVAWIARALIQPTTGPTWDDFLTRSQAMLLAQALANQYSSEIREAWKDLNIQELADLDYAEFVK